MGQDAVGPDGEARWRRRQASGRGDRALLVDQPPPGPPPCARCPGEAGLPPARAMHTAMRQMAGVLAELDRPLTIKRLRDGRRAKTAQGGKAVGRYPFGWSKDGEVAREQRVLVAVRDLRADGLRWRDLADRLNAGGGAYRPRQARPWTAARAA